MSEGALNSLSNAFKGISNVSPEAIKSTIFIARDTLGKLTGYVYKFKPWEATKLAGNISKWTGPAGAVVSLSSDLYGAYKVHELEQELKQVKDSITSLIKGAFKDIYDLLSDDEKTFDFFAPQIKEVEKVVTEMSEKASSIRKNQEKLISISSQLEQLRLPGAASITV